MSQRPGFAVATILFALLVAGALVTGGFYMALQASAERNTTDGALILAEEAMDRFAAGVAFDDLAGIEIGEDSLVVKARVSTGAGEVGTYTVNAVRAAADAFRLKATGKLSSGEMPVFCSFEVRWLHGEDLKARVRAGLDVTPLCNGEPYNGRHRDHESAR